MDLRSHHASLAIPEGATILGIQLQPLAIGHARLLTALGLSAPSSLPELVAALMLCSVKASSVMASISSRWWRLKAHLRAFWIGAQVKAASCGSQAGAHLITVAALARFSEFIAEANERPSMIAVRQQSGGSVEYQTPALAHVEHVLSADCGINPKEVFDMSMREAFWRFAVAREASGSVVLSEYATGEEYDALQSQADQIEKGLECST